MILFYFYIFWDTLYVNIRQKKSFSMIIMLLPFYQSDTALWYCVHAILGFMCEFFSYQDLLKPSEWHSTTFIDEQLFPISVWFSLLGGLSVGLGALRVDLKTSGAEGWFKNPPCVALTLPLHHHVAMHLWTDVESFSVVFPCVVFLLLVFPHLKGGYR